MFNQRKNKRFSYRPHSKDLKKKKIDNDLEAKWNEIRGNTKRKGSILNSMPGLIVILGSIFVLMYILNKYI